jgi:hypothetical protein
MSFDRPGLPHPGRPADEVDIDETLDEEGLDIDEEGDLEAVDHPGGPSRGPEPYIPRHPHGHAAGIDAEGETRAGSDPA